MDRVTDGIPSLFTKPDGLMSGEHPKALTKAHKDTRGTAAIVENEFGEARPGLEV